MKSANALKAFITDDKIIECLILFESRKMDAAKLLCSYMANKWQITTLQAVEILTKIKQEIES